MVCTIADGGLAIGGMLTATVEQVLEASSATSIGQDQIVLSANLQSDSYHVDALRNIPVGSEITLTITGNDGWDDVEYAVGALYSLVENGGVASGLQAGVNPRTAVGQKPDGTLVFYTIDGRKSGHSIGRLHDPGGPAAHRTGLRDGAVPGRRRSTTLSITEPDELEPRRSTPPPTAGSGPCPIRSSWWRTASPAAG